MRALARENVPLRAVAKDSGVISSDDFDLADRGLRRLRRASATSALEGRGPGGLHAVRRAEADGATRVQINSKMRTQAYRRGDSGSLKPQPVYACVSTGRLEANLLDTVRALVKE